MGRKKTAKRILVVCTACGKEKEVTENYFSKRKSGIFFCTRDCQINHGGWLKEASFTEEHCNHISESHKGKEPWNKGKTGVYSEETLKQMSDSNKGRKAWNEGISPSDEVREKIANSLKGNIPWNKGTKGAMVAWNKGISPSEETRQKQSASHKGKPAWNKGLKMSPEACANNSKAQKGKKMSEEFCKKNSESHKGEKSYLWQGGKSFEEYPIDWRNSLKNEIRERDNFTCQLCGKSQQENKEKLSIHHWDYDKKNLDPSNLISLCRSCHIRTNHNRKFWISIFSKFRELNLTNFDDFHQSYFI